MQYSNQSRQSTGRRQISPIPQALLSNANRFSRSQGRNVEQRLRIGQPSPGAMCHEGPSTRIKHHPIRNSQVHTGSRSRPWHKRTLRSAWSIRRIPPRQASRESKLQKLGRRTQSFSTYLRRTVVRKSHGVARTATAEPRRHTRHGTRTAPLVSRSRSLRALSPRSLKSALCAHAAASRARPQP